MHAALKNRKCSINTIQSVGLFSIAAQRLDIKTIMMYIRNIIKAYVMI